MDVLSDILKKIKLSSTVYFKSDFSSPWGMDIPKGPFAQFHIVTRGQCILKIKRETIQLFAGDIILFPLGTNHWLADTSSSNRQNGQDVMQAIMNGNSMFAGDTISTTLVCGHFEFDKSVDHPFVNELPEVIHISDVEKKEFTWLESITNLVIQEAGREHPGSSVIVTKLSEVLFVHTLRAYIKKNENGTGFLAAMQDERIGKVLKSIHQFPGQDWQLVAMAQMAGMSRTSFSNRFKMLTSKTPLDYITQWRLLQAKELLTETTKSVGQIAEEVGYQSEAAFNRVFKKRVEQTPLKFRQNMMVSNVA